MLRRKLLAFTCMVPAALAAGCATGNTINIPVPVREIIDAVSDKLLQFAPAGLAQSFKDAYSAVMAGGDWKKTGLAFLNVAQQVNATGLVPEPYKTLAATALSGLSVLLGLVSAAPNGATVPEAVAAARSLKALK